MKERDLKCVCVVQYLDVVLIYGIETASGQESITGRELLRSTVLTLDSKWKILPDSTHPYIKV